LDNKLSISPFSSLAGYEKLFKQYYGSLCIYARNIIKDSDSAEDIVHEVFIKLWEKRNEINPEQSIKSYLFTAVHNRCLNYIRDNKKFTERDEYFENSDLISEETESVEQSELEAKVFNAMNKLPEKCREVFHMCKIDELKYAEVAEKLGISIKTVENQMGKALKVLREELGHLFLLVCFIYFEHIIGVCNSIMCSI
jgi:RNA polymerase sigma-70 factor (ECF subfamily)